MACEQVKKIAVAKFDETVEVIFKLRINPRHADEQIKGSLLLPEGHGRQLKLLVLTKSQTTSAEAAGADYVGSSDWIAKIRDDGWSDFDLIVASPDVMPEIGQIAAVIGRRGYMPSPKLDTVTRNLGKTVAEFKHKRIIYKNDKTGNVHFILGKSSWSPVRLMNNYRAVLKIVQQQKPARIKGNYIKTIHLTTTMGPSLRVRLNQS